MSKPQLQICDKLLPTQSSSSTVTTSTSFELASSFACKKNSLHLIPVGRHTAFRAALFVSPSPKKYFRKVRSDKIVGYNAIGWVPSKLKEYSFMMIAQSFATTSGRNNTVENVRESLFSRIF